jgi:sigma-B regulation protein RsbU (phosphoserine phosphatase)
MYTDGVTEAHDDTYDEFGEERLQEVIKTNLDRSPQHLCDTVRSEVSSFVGNAPRSDDITLLVVKWPKRDIQME